MTFRYENPISPPSVHLKWTGRSQHCKRDGELLVCTCPWAQKQLFRCVSLIGRFVGQDFLLIPVERPCRLFCVGLAMEKCCLCSRIS
jgi:hypothetical protein